MQSPRPSRTRASASAGQKVTYRHHCTKSRWRVPPWVAANVARRRRGPGGRRLPMVSARPMSAISSGAGIECPTWSSKVRAAFRAHVAAVPCHCAVEERLKVNGAQLGKPCGQSLATVPPTGEPGTSACWATKLQARARQCGVTGLPNYLQLSPWRRVTKRKTSSRCLLGERGARTSRRKALPTSHASHAACQPGVGRRCRQGHAEDGAISFHLG